MRRRLFFLRGPCIALASSTILFNLLLFIYYSSPPVPLATAYLGTEHPQLHYRAVAAFMCICRMRAGGIAMASFYNLNRFGLPWRNFPYVTRS